MRVKPSFAIEISEFSLYGFEKRRSETRSTILFCPQDKRNICHPFGTENQWSEAQFLYILLHLCLIRYATHVQSCSTHLCFRTMPRLTVSDIDSLRAESKPLATAIAAYTSSD